VVPVGPRTRLPVGRRFATDVPRRPGRHGGPPPVGPACGDTGGSGTPRCPSGRACHPD